MGEGDIQRCKLDCKNVQLLHFCWQMLNTFSHNVAKFMETICRFSYVSGKEKGSLMSCFEMSFRSYKLGSLVFGFTGLELPIASYTSYNLSRVMRKPSFCICENKDADQLRVNRFRYIDSTILLLPKYEIASL